MKTQNIYRTLAIIFCISIFALANHAQQKAQALKFDEFEVTSGDFFRSYQDEMSFTERAKRFGEQFRKERGAKAYIIYYLGRIAKDDDHRRLDYAIDRIKSDISAKNDYTNENVIKIFGGYRERTTIEFWIAPKDAEPPQSSPTLDKSETFVCPKVYIYDRSLYNEPSTLAFSFPTYYLREFPAATINWKVSEGEIVGDSDVNEIKVKLEGKTKRTRGFLEVNNLPYPCPKVFSQTAEVSDKLFLVDDFGRLANGDIRSRLDRFASELSDNATAKGFIINYGSRIESKKFLARRVTLIRNHYKFRNFDMSRVTFIDGGYREEEATSLWLSFDDAKPVPTPTVDEKFVDVPRSTVKTRPRKKSK